MDGLRAGSRIAMGSLPHLDPSAAVQAQWKAFPEIPAWPQLPKKSAREFMRCQGLCGLPGLSRPDQEQAVFTLSGYDREEAIEILRDENENHRLGRGAFQPGEASGFFTFLRESSPFVSGETLSVKGQAIGPLSLGLILRDENGAPLLTSRESMEVLTEYLLLHCRWQAKELSALGKPVVVFLDEPMLSGLFQPEAYGRSWKDIHGWLRRILAGLQEDGVMTGLHHCGPGPWDWVFDLPVEIFHFDGFQYMRDLLTKPAGFKGYLRQGGMVSWGLVPTAMSNGSFPDPAELFRHWEDAFHVLLQKGFSREELAGRSLFSTTCGLGNGSLEVAEEASRCLGTLVSLWRAHITPSPTWAE